MPPFSDLRSDSPLNFILLERRYSGALKQFCKAGLTLARGTPISLMASKRSRTNNAHYHSVETGIYPGSPLPRRRIRLPEEHTSLPSADARLIPRAGSRCRQSADTST